MWLEAIIIGVVIGLVRGGRLLNLEQTTIRGVMFIVVGLLTQLVPFFLHAIPFIKRNATYFTLIGVGIACVAIILNIKKKGMWLVLTGASLQLLVLFCHNFKMPIRLTQATTARLAQMKLGISSGQVANYMLFSDSQHWTRYLGKVILAPDYYPATHFFGIPDIIIAIGIIWLIQSELQMTRSYGSSHYYKRYKRYK